MTQRGKISAMAGAILATCLALSVWTLHAVDRVRGEATLQEVLYIPSADTVKRMSLGYNGLMADLYWTRAVQYFGGKHSARSKQYQLLKPLLNITTTLDPHMVVAYEFGSIFLSQNPPEGAGDPQAAAELVQKGILENPTQWRLYYSLGFIEWQQLHNPQAASQAFLKGSQQPGAMIWMKVMAARVAQDADNPDTARYLWTNIYENSQDKMLKQNALKHLAAIRVDQDVSFLQGYVERYRQQYGHYPASLQELQEAGWIRRIPLDPLGDPYLIREGRIEVSRPDDLPFITKGLPPGYQASESLKSPSK